MSEAVILDNINNTQTIVDVQNLVDTRQLPINKVGIKDIKHPVCIRDRVEPLARVDQSQGQRKGQLG